MIEFGNKSENRKSDLKPEIENIKPDQIPDPEKLKQLQDELYKFEINLIATGHGRCIEIN